MRNTHDQRHRGIEHDRESVARCAVVNHFVALCDKLAVALLVAAVVTNVKQLYLCSVVAAPTK